MKPAFLFLLLTSCAHVAHAESVTCVTRCGMLAEAPNARSCDRLIAFEDEVVNLFAKGVKGWTRQSICKKLDGWNVIVHKRSAEDVCPAEWNSWDYSTANDKKPFCVIGLTHIESLTMEINTSEWRNSSLAHEMVHAIDAEDYRTHCSWRARGIPLVLSYIEGYVDEGLNYRDDCGGGK